MRLQSTALEAASESVIITDPTGTILWVTVSASVYMYMSSPTTGTLTLNYWPSPTNAALGRTNYLGCAGQVGDLPPWKTFEGAFARRSQNAFSSFSDGTSNTLLFGETTGGKVSQWTSKYSHSWMGSGVLPTAWGIGTTQVSTSDILSSKYFWYMYGSEHPAIVQFAMGDGSIRTLSQSIDQETYRRLSGLRDNLTTQFP